MRYLNKPNTISECCVSSDQHNKYIKELLDAKESLRENSNIWNEFIVFNHGKVESKSIVKSVEDETRSEDVILESSYL
jgi:glutathionylspermidine synthase